MGYKCEKSDAVFDPLLSRLNRLGTLGATLIA